MFLLILRTLIPIVHLKHFLSFLSLFLFLGGKAGANPNDSIGKVLENKIYTLPDFVLSSEIDNLNLFKLLEFCRLSKISHKVWQVFLLFTYASNV